jgi:hypothetical protein
MRVDRPTSITNSRRTFGEQLCRVARLPDAPAQLARLHQLKWGRHSLAPAGGA